MNELLLMQEESEKVGRCMFCGNTVCINFLCE